MVDAYTMKLPTDLVTGVDWFEHPDPDKGRLLFVSCSEYTLNGVIAVEAGEVMPYEEDTGVLGELHLMLADQQVKVYKGPDSET